MIDPLPPELLWGGAAGMVGAAGLLAAHGDRARQRRVRGGRPLAAGGWCIVAGALAVLAREGQVTVLVAAGVVAIGAVLSEPAVARLTAPLASVLAAGIAAVALVPADLVSSEPWVRAALVVAASLGAHLAARTDEAWAATAPGPALFAVTAAGAYLAVPDTEQAAALAGAALAPALLGWPLRRPIARLGSGGAAACVALLSWSIAVGGRGRVPSIAGALACLGLLVTLAMVPPRALAALRGRPARLLTTAAVLVHGLLVLVASRIAGTGDALAPAAVLAAAVLLAAAALGWWARRISAPRA